MNHWPEYVSHSPGASSDGLLTFRQARDSMWVVGNWQFFICFNSEAVLQKIIQIAREFGLKNNHPTSGIIYPAWFFSFLVVYCLNAPLFRPRDPKNLIAREHVTIFLFSSPESLDRVWEHHSGTLTSQISTRSKRTSSVATVRRTGTRSLPRNDS